MKETILEKLTGVQGNILLKNFTTYKIGGPAKYFFVAKTEKDLMLALKVAKDLKLSVFILGGGSNLLVSKKGFNGLVIKISISDVVLDGERATVGAGADLTKLSYFFADSGLSGLEWAAGIPSATIGGAIYGHAQAFGEKISDVVESVEAINLKTLKPQTFSKKQCQFSLKNSFFKKSKKFVIFSVVLRLQKKETKEARGKIKEFLEYRKNNHPVDFPSAGSTFVNPEVKIKDKKLLVKFPELNEYNRRGTISAGYLVARAGLAGKKIGNAQISERHSNFIINLGGAKSGDVVKLIKLAKKEVKKKFGIELEPEVQLIGFKQVF